MRDAPGARIGDYWVDGELPARSTEVAYRTTHRILPRCARIVLLKPEHVDDRDAELHLMREACVLELLRHAGVPRVFECGRLDQRPWVATEHIEGTSVEQLGAEPLTIGDALAVLRDAAAILAHAHHRGVVHRNLTPGAILRTPARDFPVCLTGWGHASINGRDGTPIAEPGAHFYGAPEAGADGGGPAADVFALGAIVFEATTLVLPEPLQRFPGIPEPFHQLLATMLEYDPGERPAAAAVHAEAGRLVELFTDGSPAIEEVEVELVDIASSGSGLPNLGWMPPEHLAGMKVQPAGSHRRRRDP
jgi:eukaryotic-like serine/threonine-protein kinase